MPKKDNTKILIVMVIAIIIIASLIITNKSRKKEDYSKLEGEDLSVAIQNKVDTMTINNLAGLGERDRIEYYVSEFIKAIENEDYNIAYDMLSLRKIIFQHLMTLKSMQKLNSQVCFHWNIQI